MASLRRLEGYLLIDNTVSGGGRQEMATYTCSHCHRQVVINPQRLRPREYCSGCDHIICDGCATLKLVAGCVPRNKILDVAQKAAFRQEARRF